MIDNGKDSRKIWLSINKWLGNIKLSLDDVIMRNMGDYGSCKDICDRFACTYSEEILKIKHFCDIMLLDKENYNQIMDRTILFRKIEPYQIISSLNSSKSPGYDGIRMCDLKLIKSAISPLIARFINLCIDKGVYPNELKIAIVRDPYIKMAGWMILVITDQSLFYSQLTKLLKGQW